MARISRWEPDFSRRIEEVFLEVRRLTILYLLADNIRSNNKRMFGLEDKGWAIAIVLAVLAIIVVVAYTVWPPASDMSLCPKTVRQHVDGSLSLESGQRFPDMNTFQQWWRASKCPLPVLTGAQERPVLHEENRREETYAQTPIYKVDDYEFSRIFGNERGGRMEIDRQNFNVILNRRAFDWPDKPLSSDERRAKYMGLREGFTAAGDLKAFVMAEPSAEELVIDAKRQFGSKKERREEVEIIDDEEHCRLGREGREVAALVAKAYASEPNYEPVVTRVGANQWEVNELKPRRRQGEYEEPKMDRVVDTSNDAVDIAFEYRERETVDAAIDPYFTATGELPYQWDRGSDPWYGPVPGMERMFGPTFDHKKWY